MRCRETNPSEGHCLASRDCAEWCQTVIPRDRFFYQHQQTMIVFVLHTVCSPAFVFNVGVAINQSCSYMLMSTILKVDVICDVTMMSTPNIIMTELRDLLHNQHIDNICYSFLSIPLVNKDMWDKICHGKLCLVCREAHSASGWPACFTQRSPAFTPPTG